MPVRPLGGPRPLAEDEIGLLVTVGISGEPPSTTEMVDLRTELKNEFRDENVGIFLRRANEGDKDIFGYETDRVIDIDIVLSAQIRYPLDSLSDMKSKSEDIVSSFASTTGSSAVIGSK